MFEGTGKYFLLIFLVLLIVYITKKISLYFIFKKTKTEPYKALIPIYTTISLVDMLDMKKKVFYMCLIPGINLFYYYQIYKQLLLAFGQDDRDAIWYVLIPMYKFPELAFKNPHFILNEYDLTSGFIQSQNALFETDKDKLPDKIELVNLQDKVDEYHDKKANHETIITPNNYEQVPKIFNEGSDPMPEKSLFNYGETNTNTDPNEVWNTSNEPEKPKEEPKIMPEPTISEDTQNFGDSVFTNKSLEPDKRHERVVVPEKHEEEVKNPVNPYNDGRPKLCPNCGARLAHDATTCFLCGTKIGS